MDSQMYFHAVRRTAKADHIDPAHEKFHWILGALGEVSEIYNCFLVGKKPQLDDETGDLLWYVANLCHAYEVDFPAYLVMGQELALQTSLDGGRFTAHLFMLNRRLDDIAQWMKRREFYQHKTVTDTQLADLILDVCHVISTLVMLYSDSSLDSIMQANIDKLAERYPTKFDG